MSDLNESTMITLRPSTIWYFVSGMFAMFICGVSFYLSLYNAYRDNQEKTMTAIQEVARKVDQGGAVQQNINENMKYNYSQLDLRLLRMESIIRPVQ